MSSKKKDEYDHPEDGEGFEIDIQGGQILRLACCECHLVHDVTFAIGASGTLAIALTRNERETKKRRKQNTKAT